MISSGLNGSQGGICDTSECSEDIYKRSINHGG